MQIGDQTRALLGGQQLVPDWAARDLAQRIGQENLLTSQAQRMALEQDAAQKVAQQADEQRWMGQFQTAYENKDARGLAVAMANPRYGKFAREAVATGDELARNADVRFFGSLSGALSSNDPRGLEIAVKSLRTRQDADRKAGQDDGVTGILIDALESGDPGQIEAVRAIVRRNAAVYAGADKAGSTLQALTEADGGFTLDPGDIRYDAAGNEIARAPFAPQTITVGPDQTVVEYNPNVTKGGDPGSGVGGGTGGSGAPRSVRNNNPGNIVDSDFARKQPGYVRSDGRFAVFETPEAGRAAQGALLGSYIDRGFNTVQKIINRWAPPSENDTGAYVRNVARELGVDPNAPLGKEAIPRLAAAIARVEGGPGSSSAGVPGATVGGGSRIIAQGPPKQSDQYRVLTPQEVSGMGLNPAVRYQMGPNGQVTAIGGQDTKTRQGRAVPQGVATAAAKKVEIRDNLTNFLNSFQDDFAGNSVTGGLENTAQGLLGTGTPGQRNWWAQFSALDNQIRNELFGASLTDGEKKAYEATTITPRMSPNQVRANLRSRLAWVRKQVAKEKIFLKKNGYDGEAVDALIPINPQARAVSQTAQQAGPVRVRSVQEARALPPGTVFITPDGRRMRR